MKKQSNIYLVGPMGSGKSTIGKQLAQLMGYQFYDSDSEIERRTGVTISWIFEIEQEKGFRKRESEMIRELTQHQGIVLATGGGVVVTPDNCQYLAENGVIVYLTVSFARQVERTRHSKDGRPLIDCEDPGARLHELNQQREPIYQRIADFTYSTDRMQPQLLVQKIKHDVESFEC